MPGRCLATWAEAQRTRLRERMGVKAVGSDQSVEPRDLPKEMPARREARESKGTEARKEGFSQFSGLVNVSSV